MCANTIYGRLDGKNRVFWLFSSDKIYSFCTHNAETKPRDQYPKYNRKKSPWGFFRQKWIFKALKGFEVSWFPPKSHILRFFGFFCDFWPFLLCKNVHVVLHSKTNASGNQYPWVSTKKESLGIFSPKMVKKSYNLHSLMLWNAKNEWFVGFCDFFSKSTIFSFFEVFLTKKTYD